MFHVQSVNPKCVNLVLEIWLGLDLRLGLRLIENDVVTNEIDPLSYIIILPRNSDIAQ